MRSKLSIRGNHVGHEDNGSVRHNLEVVPESWVELSLFIWRWGGVECYYFRLLYFVGVGEF